MLRVDWRNNPGFWLLFGVPSRLPVMNDSRVVASGFCFIRTWVVTPETLNVARLHCLKWIAPCASEFHLLFIAARAFTSNGTCKQARDILGQEQSCKALNKHFFSNLIQIGSVVEENGMRIDRRTGRRDRRMSRAHVAFFVWMYAKMKIEY